MPIGYGPPDADKVPLINIRLYSVALDLWPKRLLRDDGTPHLPASLALFQITRWYVPTEEFDGTTKERYYRKRYKGDQLQLSAPQLASASGLTVKQARDALEYLEHKGYINRTLVTLYRDGLTFPKSQFIAINIKAIIELSTVTANDTDAAYKKAEENTEWDDDDYSIVPPGATDLQGIRSDLQNVRTLGASPLQDRPFFPQVIHHKSLHQYPEEAENTNYVSIAGLEKLSPDTPKDFPPVTVSDSGAVKPSTRGTLHNVALVEQNVAQVFAEILPEQEPLPVNGKVKKAANPKAAPPPKQPKEPRALIQSELDLLAHVNTLDPGLTEQVEERIRKYPRSQPWSVSQVYLLTGIRIAKTLWPTVTSLNGAAFDEEKLLSCYKSWLTRGYNPQGLNWLFDWYKAGGPPQYKPQFNQQPAQQIPQATSVSSKPKIEISDESVVDFEKWIRAKPGYGTVSPRSVQLAAWLATNGDYDVAAQHIGNITELHVEYQATH